MAGNDVFLYSVPSDANPNDVRLRDPTTSGGGGGPLNFTIDTPGAIGLAGQTLTVAISQGIGDGAVGIAGQSVSAAVGQTLSNGSLVIAGQTVAAGVAQSLTNGSLTLAGQTLGAAVGQGITGGALTLAGQTLSAAIGQGITGGVITLAGQSLSAAVSAQIGGGAIGIAGQGVSAGIGITISAPGIEIAGQTLLLEIGVMLGGGALSVAGQTLDFAITGGTTEQPSGGFVYISAYERRLRKFEEEQRRLEEAKASESLIQDELDAQIAALLHEQEAKDLERADLARLQALADEYKGRTPDVPMRVQKALIEAQERRTFGALQALKRETDRMLEEEEFVLLLLLINE